MGRRAVVLGIAALGLALGAFSLRVARDHPGYWFAGDSAVGAVALLGAGWAILACGLAVCLRGVRPAGLLLVATGLAWFLPEWNNPGVRSALAFTMGLCLYAACPPLAAHALFAYPRGKLASPTERAGVAISYVGGVLVLGVLPALFFDPRAEGCGACPPNLVLVADRAELADDLTHVGVYLGLGWAVALVTLGAVRLARGSAANRPVMAAGVAYLGCVAATFALSLDRGAISNGTAERRLWLGEAAALVAVALAIAWSWLRGRRARSAVARLVVDLAQSPPPGGLRDALAGIVGDPGLVLVYPVAPGRLVDARGIPAKPAPGQQRTSLIRERNVVAVLGHAPGLLDDEQLVDEVTAASRLALENERLQAEVRARVEELRASRARIVEAGDAERKRLERDLHDGAQQRLVGLALSLRLLCSRLAIPELERAEAELRLAVEELRELAHGIFPAVLVDEGFAAAVEALAEDTRVLVHIEGLPEGRLPAAVETAAYTVVAAGADAARSRLVVGATVTEGVLAVDLETDAIEGLDTVGLEDRLGALDGRLAVGPGADGRSWIHAELPCAS
jgi:signal transduction histidine kinase